MFGHSLGSIQTLNALTTVMTQKEKDEMLHVYFLAGSVIASHFIPATAMGGSTALLFKVFRNFRVGIQLYSQIVRASSPTRFDMYGRNVHE